MRKRIPIKRVMSPEEAKLLRGQHVEDLEPNIHEEAMYVDADTGEPQLLYCPSPGDVAKLRWAVMNTPMSTNLRGGAGWENKSRTFGMAPRKVHMKREHCRPTTMWVEHPDEHRVLEDFARNFRELMLEEMPDQVKADTKELSAVLPDWKLGEDELWTSGVINKSSQLPYHFDAFNFPTASAMPVVRRHMRGGHLSLPEYDLVVACRDSWVLVWEGYRLLHGVTPLISTKPDAYRYSIVYYALQGMKDCFTYAKELEYGDRRRAERETAMANELEEKLRTEDLAAEDPYDETL